MSDARLGAWLHAGDMSQRFFAALKTLTWIFSVALAAVMASERLYWYWSGIDATTVTELAAFYSVAAASALWALSRFPGAGVGRATLGGAVFALVVEGVITSVVYEDGPLPVLFVMFVGWHGVLAFLGFVYLARRWALRGRIGVLAAAAGLTGVGWGVWALSSAVTDRETAEAAALDGGSADVLTPGAFALYAAWVGIVLIGAHLVMDRTWPKVGWAPSRTGRIATGLIAAALGAMLVVPFVPWAPLKFVALAWAIRWTMRRTADASGSPTVIDELVGRVRLRNLLPIMLMPATASVAYAGMWQIRDHEAHDAVYWSLIGAQVLAGIFGLAWASSRPKPITTNGPAPAKVG